ncbi:hypothetical protein ABL78_1065 [Leptomonas seymouri]|uniref:Uncharacterized protein n=1 Tax=Leptomonas seymouri TaxID=5684 RepID=A0A0N1I9D5_LEPSE|nr:hypothetical protein ABL78_1065 [Leptomonas seymouri]|eukprot:KPI89802.1 hypothetical protein ABL78_1065 [Leptomonas seymouri]
MLNRRPPLRSPGVRSTSVLITFKGLGAYEFPSVLTWPPPQNEDAANAKEGSSNQELRPTSVSPSSSPNSGHSDYVTYLRSPFSVLRSRQFCVDRCAAGMSGSPLDKSTCYPLRKHSGAPCLNSYCCCSALMYPSTFAAHAEVVERVRDDFLWSLKLGCVEDLLRTNLGTDLHARLIGQLGASPLTPTVLTCSDPVKIAQFMSREAPSATSTDDQEDAPSTSNADVANNTFVARLLLSADEDNRIRWLQEESASMEPADYYSRAPSLRALLIMWSLLQHQQRARNTFLRGNGVGGGAGSLGRGDGGSGSGGSWGETVGHGNGGGQRGHDLSSGRSPSSPVPCPRMNEIRHVLQRMEERQMEVMMSDIAAIAAIGAGGTDSAAVPDDEFWDCLAKWLKPQEVATTLRTLLSSTAPSASSAHSSATAPTEEALGLQHVLLLCLLLRYVLLVRAKAAQRDAASSKPLSSSALASRNKLLLPITAFETASDVIQLRKLLTVDPSAGGAAPGANTGNSKHRTSSVIQDAIVVLCDVLLKHAFEMAETSHLPSSSPHLPELTTWLLREMTSSSVCKFHFRRLVDRSITEALVALERSGLVNRSTMNLKVVVRQLLPLLESCGSEDLYTPVLRDVLSALEEKARRDSYAFSAEDLQYLSELGTKLFSGGPSEGSTGGYGRFDETARGQMEELHVMDGSPWALCVSSYRSLKEMLQGIVRDQQRLNEQVRNQLRQFSGASGLSAVISRTDRMAESEEATDKIGAAWNSEVATSPNSTSSVPGTASPVPKSAVQTSSSAGLADEAGDSTDISATQDAPSSPASPPRIPVPLMLRQRFLMFIEDIVKAQVNGSAAHSERPIVLSSELFAFVTQHVPVPNIQDEYRRKIFLLVNIAEDPATTRRRIARRREARKRWPHAKAAAGQEEVAGWRWRNRRLNEGDADDTGTGVEGKGAVDADPHGGANDIPAELRFLVSSLPLTLSPWASVMILREVLAESAGRNPRYTYVLNAAIDLQLPISTTRSRIATTLNMWRFLNTQSHKLRLKESLMMKQRCAWNLPLSYVLSSYWSLLTWLALASIITLNVFGIDWESRIVANSFFRMFAPWEEICVTPSDEDGAEESWTTQAAADLAADYFEQAEIADCRRKEHWRSSTNVFLSSASYLIFGHDDQRRPMTVIPIGSDRADPAEVRAAEEYAASTAVLRELSLHVPFPFFVDIERALPMELVEMRIADCIRRVSNKTWFLPRMIIRIFPLGRHYTEHKLILHTCTQANLTRRRVTFLLYIHDGVAVTPQYIRLLNESYLCKQANLVLVVHESSLLKGGTLPASLAKISQASATNQDAGSSVGIWRSVAIAAADVTESVLPDEVKEATSASDCDGAAPDQQMRVLPLCRQYYAKDGTVAPAAVQGNAESVGRSKVAAAAGKVWRGVRRLVPYGDSLSGAAGAKASAPLPLFASAFSAQRASLYRRHQQQQLGSGNDSTRNKTHFFEQCTQWWKQVQSGTLAMVEPTMRVTRAGGWRVADVKYRKNTYKNAVHAERKQAQEKAETTAVGRQQPSDYPSDSQDDAMECRAGSNVVSVSFTALRHLMAGVSVPVTIPHTKQSIHGSDNTTAGDSSL